MAASPDGSAADRHNGGRRRPHDAGQQQADQPHEQLFVVRGAGNDLRQPAEHFDPLVGVAIADTLQIRRTERLLVGRRAANRS